MNGFQWMDLALAVARLHRQLARAINEIAELSADVLSLNKWRQKVMATFDEISAQLDTIVAGQAAAAVTATEIAADITDLIALVQNQNQGGLSEGQTTAVANKLTEIAASATALQEALATAAAAHTPVPVEPPPPVEG